MRVLRPEPAALCRSVVLVEVAALVEVFRWQVAAAMLHQVVMCQSHLLMVELQVSVAMCRSRLERPRQAAVVQSQSRVVHRLVAMAVQ